MTDFSELVYRGVESDVLDYKAPVNWNALTKQQKAKFVRHSLAFANTRGGAIVIGVREDVNGHPSIYEGLSDEECHSFDPSGIAGYINSHVDPAIDLTVERPLIDGKRYAILVIKPFTNIPHVAIHSIDEELRCGVFYIRSVSASSRPASRAGEMHDLLRRALRNQRDLLGNLLRDILAEQKNEDISFTDKHLENTFPVEYDESVAYFERRLNSSLSPETPILDVAVFPQQSGLCLPLAHLRKSAEAAMLNMGEKSCRMFMNSADMDASYATNVSLRGMNKQRTRFWQLFQNGLLHFRCAMETCTGYDDLAGQISSMLNFITVFYQMLNINSSHLHMRTAIENSMNMQLVMPNTADQSPARCRIEKIYVEKNFSAADDCNTLSDEIMAELSVRFNAPVIPEKK